MFRWNFKMYWKKTVFVLPRPEPTNFLIKNNASVSAVDKVNRNTPLHCAVLAGNVDAAHVLLEAGASVEAENIKVRRQRHICKAGTLEWWGTAAL